MDRPLMVLPRWLARFNRRVTNRVLGLIPRRISPFVIVHHIGRNSGRRYATLAAAFPTPAGFVLTPTYGPEADWVRNVLTAGWFGLDRKGDHYTMTNARLIPRPAAWPHLPGPIRIAMRLMRIEWYLMADSPPASDSVT